MPALCLQFHHLCDFNSARGQYSVVMKTVGSTLGCLGLKLGSSTPLRGKLLVPWIVHM